MKDRNYSIRTPLNSSWLDLPIYLNGGNTRGGKKAIPFKVIALMILMGMILFVLLTQTFLKKAGWWKWPFSAFWIFLAVLLFTRDKSGRLRVNMIFPLWRYIQKEEREIITRTLASADPFQRMTGIRQIYPKSGLIEFMDNQVGFLYRVVGNAAVLLFDEDADQILTEVENFYHSFKDEYEMIWITAKNSQKVDFQVAELERKLAKMRDPEVREMIEQEIWLLQEEVGKKSKSTHQYLILKADSDEALKIGQAMLKSEVERSPKMLKSCSCLKNDDLYDVLRLIYQSRQTI